MQINYGIIIIISMLARYPTVNYVSLRHELAYYKWAGVEDLADG